MDDPNTGVPPAWIAAIYGSMGVLCAAGVGRGVVCPGVLAGQDFGSV